MAKKVKTKFPLEIPGERHSGVPLRTPLTTKDLTVKFNTEAQRKALAARANSTGQKQK
jgi:hypothetical protein